MTFRKLAVLVTQLPRTSRLGAARAGDDDRWRWGDQEHLLAIIADRLAGLTVTVGYKDSGKKPPGNAVRMLPRPKLRPGLEPDDDGMAADLVAAMGRGELPPGVTFVPIDGPAD